MSSTESITLEGTQEQVSELLRAVNNYRTILFTLGGDSLSLDMAIEDRISKLNYWQEHITGRCQKTL